MFDTAHNSITTSSLPLKIKPHGKKPSSILLTKLNSFLLVKDLAATVHAFILTLLKKKKKEGDA